MIGWRFELCAGAPKAQRLFSLGQRPRYCGPNQIISPVRAIPATRHGHTFGTVRTTTLNTHFAGRKPSFCVAPSGLVLVLRPQPGALPRAEGSCAFGARCKRIRRKPGGTTNTRDYRPAVPSGSRPEPAVWKPLDDLGGSAGSSIGSPASFLVSSTYLTDAAAVRAAVR